MPAQDQSAKSQYQRIDCGPRQIEPGARFAALIAPVPACGAGVEQRGENHAAITEGQVSVYPMVIETDESWAGARGQRISSPRLAAFAGNLNVVLGDLAVEGRSAHPEFASDLGHRQPVGAENPNDLSPLEGLDA